MVRSCMLFAWVKRVCNVQNFPENIHTHPMEGHWKFRGGGGLKSQNF